MEKIKSISTHPGYIPKSSQDFSSGGNGSGGGDMESRVAKLESDVEYIKRDVHETLDNIRNITSEVNDIKVSMALIIQKLDGLSKLPTEEKMNTRFMESNVKFIEVMSEIKVAAEKTESKIKDVRLQIIFWILGLPSVLFGLYKLYTLLPVTL
ncbi:MULTISPECIES: hypothetical protein [Providencia]|uniref:Uncharacterized protein n=2 Tax=Providencia TaxID=586 RepID=A0ABD5L2Y8_PROST|nr:MULTISPECIES: hypothetical protein [Providencia]ELR5046514.1 hypothetical protein [Providencia rettgeri]MCR4180173.1 hypothetical protein [Providencia vermicola]URE77008.1 hypothetical protein MWH14_11095 [Providencia stuartii]MBZ3680463.1 hypothetical protein [Providencia rettgeri]MCG9536775.1 hypothetical protein [Providencia huaxiensis]